MALGHEPIHVGVDVGGTFTDIAVSIPGTGRLVLHKLASTPHAPERAIIEGIRQVLEAEGLSAKAIVKLAHGTTVGTNALIERRIGRVGLITTEGFRDLLEIGRQTRPKVYDIHSDHPAPIVPRRLRLEVGERILADGTVHRPLDEAGVAAAALRLAEPPVDCVVVCFLHSYGHPGHEQRAVEILRAMLPPAVSIVSSAAVFPEFREYERFSTAVLNGALLTVMREYLDRLTGEAETLGILVEPKVSQSSGGLMSVRVARQLPIRASLSGPAAGAIGAAKLAGASGHARVITLDMGGTSSDVSLLIDGETREVRERSLAGFPLRMPSIDVNAVGAGGGSIAWIDLGGLLKVGPMSAGAAPGPACYGRGGTAATVTDANVVLGRLNGEALLLGRMPIRKELAEAAVDRLAADLGLGLEETALGIIRVVCATMVRAIRSISVERGEDPGAFALLPFGGAGPLHAGDVAREMEMSTVLVPRHPGILCAQGAMGSDLVADFVRTLLVPLSDCSLTAFEAARDDLVAQAEQWFGHEQIDAGSRRLRWRSELRYVGQNYEIGVPLSADEVARLDCGRLTQRLHAAHEAYYGFSSPSEPVQFVNLRLKAVGEATAAPLPELSPRPDASPLGEREVLFGLGRRHTVPVFLRDDLAPGQHLCGPAVVEQLDTTLLLHPGDTAVVDGWGSIVVAVHA